MHVQSKRNRISLRTALLTGAGTILGAAVAARLHRPSAGWISRKVVVITGGSRGLGLLLAGQFGKAGARLVLIARKQDELERAKELLLSRREVASPEDILLIEADLTRPADIEHFISRVLDQFGQIDVLVNNASLIHVGPVEKHPIEAYRESMETGFFAMVETTLSVLPHMLGRKSGAIVNITSVGGKVAVPHLAPYTGTKFAAVGFSETLCAELRPRGIRVTTVCPGLMRTGSFPNAIVVGDLEKEYRWFAWASAIPGLSHSAESAARKIFRAVCAGRAEITIGADTWLATRFAALAPEMTQSLAGMAGSLLLPKPNGTSRPTEARHSAPPRSAIFRWLGRTATDAHNEPRP